MILNDVLFTNLAYMCSTLYSLTTSTGTNLSNIKAADENTGDNARSVLLWFPAGDCNAAQLNLNGNLQHYLIFVVLIIH